MKIEVEPNESKVEVLRLGRTSKNVLGICTFALFLIYGWLRLQGIEIGPAIAEVPPNRIVQTALVIYYFSWTFGLINDTSEQEEVYLSVPTRGRFPWQAVGIAIAITALFAMLCYVDTDLHPIWWTHC